MSGWATSFKFRAAFAGKAQAPKTNGCLPKRESGPDLIRGREEFDRPTWHYVNFPHYLTEGDRGVLEDNLRTLISNRACRQTPIANR